MNPTNQDRDTAAQTLYGPAWPLLRNNPWCQRTINRLAARISADRLHWFSVGVEVGYGAAKDETHEEAQA